MIVPARTPRPGPQDGGPSGGARPAADGTLPHPAADEAAPSSDSAVGTDAAAASTTTSTDRAGDAVVALVAPPSDAELVEGAVATWRAGLVELAGGSTLADVDLLGDAALDLSSAHPSGMAQLFAGRPTRLSSLVREGGAAATARRRARAVSTRAAAFAQRWGIAPTYLAIGVATWTDDGATGAPGDDLDVLASAVGDGAAAAPADASGADAAPLPGAEGTGAPAAATPAPRTVRAPVLLRPVTLRPRGTAESDHELELEPAVELNPVLARALRSRGALLDPAALARGTFDGGRFDAGPALARVEALGAAVLPGFALAERVVVGAFVHPGQVLVDDLDALTDLVPGHEVLAALAGVEDAAAAVRRPLPEPVRGDRDPGAERGVGDLDPAQQHVLDVVATGAHLFVDAPAGADTTGTVAALVTDAAASGRTVLYVPGHRRAAAALAARLDALGVGDLLLDVAPDAGWRATASRRLLGALTLEEPVVDEAGLASLRTELVAHRERLRAGVVGLHAVREPWGVSAYDALQELARLTAARPAPRTRVRLPRAVAAALGAERRAALGADLARAAALDAFTPRAAASPWYGADLRTDDEADVARHRLDRLLDTGLPALRGHVAAVAAETGLAPATTLAGWAEQLALLEDIRTSLDTFVPLVFERTAADLVAATADRAWRESHGVTLGFWTRRRLRRQARDMVRLGRPVADLHAALVRVQEQRDAWQARCPSGGWPRLPEALQQVVEEHAGVRADVQALAHVLAGTPEGGDLARTPLPDLVARLERLRAGAAGLVGLPERTVVLHRLRAAGLGDLVADLTDRRVGAGLAAAELDLAWWSTVFEGVLGDDPALAGQDGVALGALAARYAALDRSHVASLSGPVLGAVVRGVRAAVAAHPQQVESLFAELVEERLHSLRETVAAHPDVAPRLRPVVAASPMLVPQVLPAARCVDLVVLDAAADLHVEVTLSALARGRQVVVVGDARCAPGSAVAELAEVLPSVSIPADASRRDPYLTDFLARHGYGGVLRATPLPTTEPLVHHEVVDGTGMPSEATGTVESTREEVERVVDLVISHALTRPAESLAVVTVSPVHAERVAEAVLSEVRDNPALGAFFDAARPEPFLVTDVTNVAGLRREAVVLSLGLGRTPHRRVLHRFGPVSAPGGERLLLDTLAATRRRLTVVSCFGADDLDPHRTRGPGAHLLRDLLAFARDRAGGSTRTWEPLPDVADATAPAGSAIAAAAAVVGSVSRAASDEAVADASAPRGEHAAASGGSRARAGGDDATAGPAGAAPREDVPGVPDRLVLDLADRLWRHGLTVVVDHGIPGGTRIPLAVGHPDVPDRLLVAVLTDDAAYVAEPSVRVRDRQVPERLERLGWSVVRVWSAAAFLDPAAEVDRIRRAVHALVPAPTAQRAAQTGTVAVVPVPVDDEPDEVLDPLAPPTAPTDVDGEGVEPEGAEPEHVEPEGVEPEGVEPGSSSAGSATVGSEDAHRTTAEADATTTGEAPATTAAAAAVVDAAPATREAAAATAAAAPAGDGPAGGGPGAEPASARRPAAARLVLVEQPTLAVPVLPRPDVRPGLPISAYSDDQLDDLLAWLRSDGLDRSREELADALRAELGVTRRSFRIDQAVRAAIVRALS
ncbi:ATP-binding protein [Cellulomonas marina]|uniref:Restriction endonuclease type II-like domain-containing protein n=1 Tax=Cellulomonas marina TaxID=988821 RepID=A0A1I0X5S4_9CELL|nr:ATP-binding protein [Cellulomonas marina]GIG28968.1 hypothetical protein Cma02nite_15680 [Cellulomonas marina]SFA96281.1 hypothetical protein SAMN05421867_104146 [Cellulomonas marina]